MISATQLKKGMTIKLNGELYRVFSLQHLTPGNKRGMVQTNLKSLRSGSIIDHRFRSEDRIEQAYLENQEMEFIYADGGDYHFMNTETFEQIQISQDMLGDAVPFLVANLKLQIQFHDGSPLGIDLPASVTLQVVATEPSIKGATVSNVTKPATLETGLVIQVPPFINQGETIRVDTTEGRYMERVKG